jgi:hypothetical protein
VAQLGIPDRDEAKARQPYDDALGVVAGSLQRRREADATTDEAGLGRRSVAQPGEASRGRLSGAS